MTTFNKSDVQLISASEVDESLLEKYFQKTFPHRSLSFPLIWKWLNNSNNYNEKIPLVLVYKGEIIGYMGLKPIDLRVLDRTCSSGWAIDLRIYPDYRNQGLGQILSKELFKYAEILLGFPNEKSGPLLKKIGWQEGGKSFTHFFPIQPLDHPRFTRILPNIACKLINKIAKPFFQFKYKKFSQYEFQIREINSIVLDEFTKNCTINEKIFITEKIVTPLRDKKFLQWRVLESPNINKYRLFSINGIEAIILLNNNRGKYIDILSVSNFANHERVIDLIGSICLYASKNNYSYVRILISNNIIGDKLRNKLGGRIKEYNFIFYTKDKYFESQLLSYKWHWELIDSDFEYLEPNMSKQ